MSGAPIKLVDPQGRTLTKSDVARARAAANSDRGSPWAFEGAGFDSAWTRNWHAFIRSPDLEWLPQRDNAVARARSLVNDNPVAAAAMARKRNSAVGSGWRLTPKPNARALGITPEQARELAAQISAEWRLYAYSHNFQIDAERQSTFRGLLNMAANHLGVDGEALGLVEWAADEPTRYKTRLRIVHPDRLSNPSGRINDRRLRGGIEHNDAGVPVIYYLREQHPVDYFASGSYVWQPWSRYTPWGRPQVVHAFDRLNAGQTRGISRFVSCLKSFRAFSRFDDAVIQKATIAALFAFFVQSSAGPEAVSDSFRADDLKSFNVDRTGYYEKNPVEFGEGVRVPVLPYGDEIKNATAAAEMANYESTVRAILRLIAASLGVTYEEVTMDYSQTNYSSARAAMLHAIAEIEAFVAILREQLVKPLYVAWLEEAFDRGYVTAPEGAPSFYDAPDAYAEARWIGPKRGYIDPTKEILAAAARIEAGISTLEDECAEQGKDWEEVQDERLFEEAREQQRRKELGLLPDLALAQAAQDTKNPFRTAPDPAPEDDTAPQGPPPEDQRPGKPAPQGIGGRLKRLASRVALSAIGRFADTADHEAFLDARLPRRD